MSEISSHQWQVYFDQLSSLISDIENRNTNGFELFILFQRWQDAIESLQLLENVMIVSRSFVTNLLFEFRLFYRIIDGLLQIHRPPTKEPTTDHRPETTDHRPATTDQRYIFRTRDISRIKFLFIIIKFN